MNDLDFSKIFHKLMNWHLHSKNSDEDPENKGIYIIQCVTLIPEQMLSYGVKWGYFVIA